MKILIVDDEVLARIGLTNAIDWNAHGYCIVGDAGDVETALKLARMYKPDIVLVDIVMPGIGGLELISRLKKELPLSKYIIISCMDDKEYYKQALKLEVSGYINKTGFQSEELLSLLQEVSRSISKNRVIGESDEEAYHRNYYAILTNFLNRAIKFGNYQREQVIEKLQSFDIAIKEPYRLLVIRTNNPEYTSGSSVEKSAIVVCHDMIQAVGEGFVFDNMQQEILALMSVSESVMPEDDRSFYCRIRKTFEQYFDICPDIGVSAAVHDFGRLKEAYQMAKEALNTAFFLQKPFYEYIRRPQSSFIPESIRKDINRLMSMQLDQADVEVEALLVDLRKCILEEEFFNISACRNIYARFLYHIYEQAMTKERYCPEKELELEEPAVLVEQCGSLDELHQKMLDIVRQIYREDWLEVSTHHLVAKVQEYVNLHIYEKILVEDIAREVYISPAYLGRMFKKITGKSLHNYVLEQKLLFSKRLLQKGQDVNKVAELLEFNSASHYISLFKRQEGITPKKYLQSLDKKI